ncbi:hypothetical protein [Arthrobacter rhombi]|uniref:Phage protein n=1 Tax=Arthrobacter rhombi TaxID=71253 RepID=A0A1R4FPW8_9MICC|nr:hypothetical protein [Arthrobacter rhombi]SJM57958.1 Phage protein [Arthrobacter rhombi]
MHNLPKACPCADAHRRLMDLHEDIHRTIEFYEDPNEFRRWLNSAIQNSRGVTFLLQKRKAKWADFDTWYGSWQDAAKQNAVLRWGVTARNRVVKEEDLKTFSEARISFYGERLKEVEDTFEVSPSLTVDMIIARFANVAGKDPTRRKGMIRVQRRWVDDQLPAYELVSALREMYAAVAKIVWTAHQASGVPSCLIQPFARICVTSSLTPSLSCLPPGDPMPSKLFDLETGEVATFKYVKIERDEQYEENGVERYGALPGFSVDPIEHAYERLQLSRKFLESDGYSGPMLVLSKGDEIRMHGVIFHDNEPRELKVAAAVDLEGAWPFDGAIYSSETWVASPGGRGSRVGVPADQLLGSNAEFFNIDTVGNRDEALIVVALAADGRSRCLVQPFGRTADGIVYGPLVDDSSGSMVLPFLKPVWQQWPDRGRQHG